MTEHERQLKVLEEKRERLHRATEIHDKQVELRRMRRSLHPLPTPNTTKLIALFLFLNFTLVEVYAMVAMWYFQNLDALYVLITTVLAEPLTFAVYAAKSYLGKREEERVKLEREQLEELDVMG